MYVSERFFFFFSCVVHDFKKTISLTIPQDVIVGKNILLLSPGLEILNSWVCLYRMFHVVSLNQTKSPEVIKSFTCS